jgi:hypothetical protein
MQLSNLPSRSNATPIAFNAACHSREMETESNQHVTLGFRTKKAKNAHSLA